jgi:hypothetical protein
MLWFRQVSCRNIFRGELDHEPPQIVRVVHVARIRCWVHSCIAAERIFLAAGSPIPVNFYRIRLDHSGRQRARGSKPVVECFRGGVRPRRGAGYPAGTCDSPKCHPRAWVRKGSRRCGSRLRRTRA